MPWIFEGKFTPSQVLEAAGLSGSLKGRREELLVCPKCGKKKLYYNTENGTSNCKYASCPWYSHSPLVKELFSAFTGCDEKDAVDQIMRYVHGNSYKETNEYEQKYQERLQKEKETHAKLVDLVAVEFRDKTYRELIKLLGLSSDHKKNLLKRGIPESALSNYCTIDESLSKEAALKLQEMGCQLHGVPGFYKENGQMVMRKYKRGIMIPFLNHNGLIYGCQIRKDNPLVPKRDCNGVIMKDAFGHWIMEEGAKYTWFSTNDCEEGASQPAFIHYAFDFRNGKPVLTGDTIGLTEGPLKADIAHLHNGLRMPFLAVPGVSSLGYLEKELLHLKSLGVKRVYNCMDMDEDVNDGVAVGTKKSNKIIIKCGLEPVRLEWNRKFKGIDDYLIAKERGELR